MKAISFPLLLSLFLSLVLVACGGRTNRNASSATDKGVVQFTMDGVDWISAPPGHPDSKLEEEAITDGNTLVRIQAFGADGSHLALEIFQAAGNLGPGTYPITQAGMRGFYKKDFRGGGGYLTNGMPDNPGSITITELTDDHVAGTFSFRLRNSANPEDIREVTKGSFDVMFSNY
ncbi:hypothetical protein POV27_10930 [Aureisphaera galaxeae]|uniref:hypothetical protein n=1 Tax=Aureisphaera galaxeae TaxID=1538023 RepID=UPI00234FB906|nr:hypothetical protein [Aureisphaera galaxeae]MDC8004563.1 hypothetical protein [Aureisphaera galaxeae]